MAEEKEEQKTSSQAEEVKKLLKETKDIVDESLVEQSLIDNKLEFEVDNVKYKIRKPTFKEKQEVYAKKVRKFTELLRDKNYMLEKDLRKMYKERGIDIEELESKFKNLEHEKNNLNMKLGQALVERASDDELRALKEELEKVRDRQIDISIEKTNLLDYSIEQQVFSEAFSYLLFLIAEKWQDDKWVRVWNTYTEFENTEEKLIKTFAFYGALIVKDEIQ